MSIGLLPLADGLVVKSEEFVTSHTVAWGLWVERSPTDHTTLSSSDSGTWALSGLGSPTLIDVVTLCMRASYEGTLSDSPKSGSTHCLGIWRKLFGTSGTQFTHF